MQKPFTQSQPSTANQLFSGNIYIFHAFDVGDDINLDKIQHVKPINLIPLSTPKYFTNYHKPLGIKPPQIHKHRHAISCKIHNFGAISLTYQVPFTDTLENIRRDFDRINMIYYEQSLIDVKYIYDKIHSCIMQPKFFQTRSSYTVLQVNPTSDITDVTILQKNYGNVIASLLRFEIETLSEYQKNEILDSAIGYFRGDLIIVDTDASFIYDDEYKDLLDLYEFANIQQLELRYFDRQLDKQLNKIYEGSGRKPPLKAYLPFIGTSTDPIDALGKLKVDISVIAERLGGSIKLAGEPYYMELYSLLVKKLDLKNWQEAIDRKLDIVHDIQTVYQDKIDVIREDMLSVLVILLIFIELIIGILHYFK